MRWIWKRLTWRRSFVGILIAFVVLLAIGYVLPYLRQQAFSQAFSARLVSAHIQRLEGDETTQGEDDVAVRVTFSLDRGRVTWPLRLFLPNDTECYFLLGAKVHPLSAPDSEHLAWLSEYAVYQDEDGPGKRPDPIKAQDPPFSNGFFVLGKTVRGDRKVVDLQLTFCGRFGHEQSFELWKSWWWLADNGGRPFLWLFPSPERFPYDTWNEYYSTSNVIHIDPQQLWADFDRRQAEAKKP